MRDAEGLLRRQGSGPSQPSLKASPRRGNCRDGGALQPRGRDTRSHRRSMRKSFQSGAISISIPEVAASVYGGGMRGPAAWV